LKENSTVCSCLTREMAREMTDSQMASFFGPKSNVEEHLQAEEGTVVSKEEEKKTVQGTLGVVGLANPT
jgi:hypothetical protein